MVLSWLREGYLASVILPVFEHVHDITVSSHKPIGDLLGTRLAWRQAEAPFSSTLSPQP
jgi:hypothetical protein